MSHLEIAAFILNVLGVWLTSKQYRICWLVNIVAVILYMILFYQVNLFADAALQAVFVIMQIYGWYSWSKATVDRPLRAGYMQKPIMLKSIAIGAVGGLFLGLLFSVYTQASLPWLDSMLALFSLVASYWAAKKYIESWAMWCILDAIYVLMYLYKSLNLTAFLYFLFILLALNGWRMWKQQWKAEQHNTVML
ncbi:nicotinamide riboside transporter PnuC [Acinetobacter bouvetii]|uniref:Nicotinamide riboside transporter PnuC n=1 Tax=Acinetobacter bouvetii TaxID=202951 RepID=A0A4Q7ARJ6_9GAMM|nr:nicotinamide riboside transporter PnuC [Acinetobacter bouvetii]RZG64443.1 nicotinamide riboside transporter PnuC [Acinetobacter bouvetii]